MHTAGVAAKVLGVAEAFVAKSAGEAVSEGRLVRLGVLVALAGAVEDLGAWREGTWLGSGQFGIFQGVCTSM